MIDGKEITTRNSTTRIPIADIERSIEIYKAQIEREKKNDHTR
jgi:hypothetical protein